MGAYTNLDTSDDDDDNYNVRYLESGVHIMDGVRGFYGTSLVVVRQKYRIGNISCNI